MISALSPAACETPTDVATNPRTRLLILIRRSQEVRKKTASDAFKSNLTLLTKIGKHGFSLDNPSDKVALYIRYKRIGGTGFQSIFEMFCQIGTNYRVDHVLLSRALPREMEEAALRHFRACALTYRVPELTRGGWRSFALFRKEACEDRPVR